jgi:hypothetical protein
VRWQHVTGDEAGDRVDGVRRWRFNTGGDSVVVVSKLGFRFFRGGRGRWQVPMISPATEAWGAGEGGSAVG